MTSARIIIFALTIIGLSFPLSASIPDLKNLSYGNPGLQGLRREVAGNLRSTAGQRRLIHGLRFLKYRVKKGDNFYHIMARTAMNADTLASLNGIVNPAALSTGDILLIPNARGVFEKGKAAEVATRLGLVPEQLIATSRGWFAPGHRFNRIRMNFFLGHGFLKPLLRGRLTSKFGMRRDPFTRRSSFHGGIDIGAPRGTQVRATQDGTVAFAGRRKGYGKLIIIQHAFGYQTYYGHLSRIQVRKGQKLKAGVGIGKVGSTGRSTGPHLHFEVRKGGVKKRPRFVHGIKY